MTDPERSGWRSSLLVAASDEASVEAALKSQADRVILDLDDTVPASKKESARKGAVQALGHLDWSGPRPAVRVNAPDNRNCRLDLEAILASADELRPSTVCIPRVTTPTHVLAVDWLMEQLEGDDRSVGLEIQIETAEALERLRDLISASRATKAVVFGHGDFAASLGFPLHRSSQAPAYASVGLQTAMFDVRVSAAAAGIVALDGPHADQSEFETFLAFARGIGFDGIWCVSEQQVAMANMSFLPQPEEVQMAEAIIREAERHERGDSVDESFDAAAVAAAQKILDRKMRYEPTIELAPQTPKSAQSAQRRL